MAITRTDVTDRFAEFTSIGDPEFDDVLADAALQINTRVFGDKADLGTVYLAAHLLGCAHPSLIPPGRVTSEEMDGTSYKYAVADHQAAGDDLDSTPYGRLFKRLRAQLPGARFVMPC